MKQAFCSLFPKLMSQAKTLLEPPPPGTLVVAKYAFQATHEDHISFVKHDIIEVISTQNRQGWWHGTKDGVQGFFPYNYVIVVRKEPRSGLQGTLSMTASGAPDAAHRDKGHEEDSMDEEEEEEEEDEDEEEEDEDEEEEEEALAHSGPSRPPQVVLPNTTWMSSMQSGLRLTFQA